MYYVLNGNTIDISEPYDSNFFNQLKDDFYFPYEVLRVSNHKSIVKDIETEKKIGSQELVDALLLQDYDIQGYICAMLDSFLSITDVPNIVCGTTSDSYSIDSDDYQGDQYSFAELAYENNWCIVSNSNVEVEDMVTKIVKNDVCNKTRYKVSNLTQVYLAKAVNDENFLGKYFTSFDRVFCVRNCTFDNWTSINETGRQKILTTFYKEIEHVIHNKFGKLGHFHGRNTNRVEKINDNLFEYRISNPNYRIYYTRADDKLIILLSLLKDRSDISTTTMSKLMNLKNNKYEKLIN